MGEGNRKLSKRDPQSSLNLYREQGYLPEGLLNYLALLGWSMGEDREFFSQGAAGRGVHPGPGVSANPARFDLKKCTAINGDWIRALPADELARAGRRRCWSRRERAASRSPQADSRDPARGDPAGAGADGDARPGRRACSGSCSPTRRRSRRIPTTPRGCSGPTRAPGAAEPARGRALAATGRAVDARRQIEAALRRGAHRRASGLKPKVAFGSLRVAVDRPAGLPPLVRVASSSLGRERTLAADRRPALA